jgi:hypothetical protein
MLYRKWKIERYGLALHSVLHTAGSTARERDMSATEALTSLVRSPSRRRRGPISKHVKALERTKVWTWVPTGPETKIGCANYCSALCYNNFRQIRHLPSSRFWLRQVFRKLNLFPSSGKSMRFTLLRPLSNSSSICWTKRSRFHSVTW